jgi:hypothetical protein
LDCAQQSHKTPFTPIHPSIRPPAKTSSTLNQQLSTKLFLTPVPNPVQIFLLLLLFNLTAILCSFDESHQFIFQSPAKGNPSLPSP